MEQALRTLSTHAIPILLALTMPCALQAWLANRLGDPTPKLSGRLTWDPIKHVDLVGTIILPVFFILLSATTNGLGFLVGWGKPVPIETHHFRKLRRDLFLVESPIFLGPLLLAVFWAVIGRFMVDYGVEEHFFYEVVKAGIFVGLIFFAIALIPLPPFPLGNAILRALPASIQLRIAPIVRWLPLILIAVLISGALRPFIQLFAAIGALFVFPIHKPI